MPYPFRTAVEMFEMGRRSGKSIAAMKHENELAGHDADAFEERLNKITRAMDDCIDRGLRMDGILPGGLSVRRRARGIHEQL